MNSVQSKRSFGEAGLEGGCDAKRFSDASSYAAKMLDGPLGRIGLRREPGDASAGALYQGDGVLSSGWYWAWSHRQEFVVVACDFTLLERLPFRIDVERYFAVRRESSGMLPRASVSAFMETLPRTSTIVLPKGVRFSYVEVEYYDDYCEAVFGGDVGRALSPLASCLGELKGAASWDPDIEGMLAGIGPGMASGVGGALALSSLADGLMSKLVGMRERIGGGVSAQDRRSILECVDFVRREIGSAIRQEDLTGVAKMGPTKFKRLFKRVTGMTATDFIASERIAHAKLLLATTDQSVGEVARACGFKRATSFSALFSRLVGMSPSKWRSSALVSFDADPEQEARRCLAANTEDLRQGTFASGRKPSGGRPLS